MATIGSWRHIMRSSRPGVERFISRQHDGGSLLGPSDLPLASLMPRSDPNNGLTQMGWKSEPVEEVVKCELINDKQDPCAFVKIYCGDVPALFDYLHFRYCTVGEGEAEDIVAYCGLLLWLGLLIMLLASTADVFFMPALNFLSEVLQLSPAVAGITLMAMGNGAPDVFTAIAGEIIDYRYSNNDNSGFCSVSSYISKRRFSTCFMLLG